MTARGTSTSTPDQTEGPTTTPTEPPAGDNQQLPMNAAVPTPERTPEEREQDAREYAAWQRKEFRRQATLAALTGYASCMVSEVFATELTNSAARQGVTPGAKLAYLAVEAADAACDALDL